MDLVDPLAENAPQLSKALRVPSHLGRNGHATCKPAQDGGIYILEQSDISLNISRRFADLRICPLFELQTTNDFNDPSKSSHSNEIKNSNSNTDVKYIMNIIFDFNALFRLQDGRQVTRVIAGDRPKCIRTSSRDPLGLRILCIATVHGVLSLIRQDSAWRVSQQGASWARSNSQHMFVMTLVR